MELQVRNGVELNKEDNEWSDVKSKRNNFYETINKRTVDVFCNPSIEFM